MSGWTDERVATLRKLWAEGLSASQIAKELGGVTRSAVIGKKHRLKLPRRAPTPSRNDVQRRVAARRKLIAPVRVTKPAPVVMLQSELRAIAELPPLAAFGSFGCPYMPGDPKQDTRICGRALAPCSPYCADHTKLCYTPSTKRRRPVEDLARAELRRTAWAAL